jgi:hypothetical protein
MSEDPICFNMLCSDINQARYLVPAEQAFLNTYNRIGDYIYHLAHYMFAERCRCEYMDQFTKFIDLVAKTDSSISPPFHPDPTSTPLSTAPHPAISVTAHHR